MSSDTEISKLDISKNLLQMNFMRRTLIALEKLEKPIKREELSSVADFKFPMPQSVVDVLSRRLENMSKRPVVRHVPGRIGVANFGLRASYGGFNLYLSEKSNSNSTAPVNEEHKKKGKHVGVRKRHSTCRLLPNRRKRPHDEPHPAPAKRFNREHSL